MSQIQLIEKASVKYIMLEQFIPNWTEMIEEMDEKQIEKYGEREDFAQSVGLQYKDPKYCLVGEARHFSRHRCDECLELSHNKAQNALHYGHETFQNFKLELFTHMLEAHSELMINNADG